MNFDTSMIETPCIEGVDNDLYGTADIKFDADGRPLGTISLQEWMDELGQKMIEHYGEGFRHKLNYSRAERGMNPL